MGEKKILHIVIKDNRELINDLFSDFKILELKAIETVYQQNPWYVESITINSLSEINNDRLKEYLGFWFYFEQYGIAFEIYNNYLMVKYYSEVTTEVDISILPILIKWFKLADFAVIGFETEFNIQDVRNSINYFKNTQTFVVLVENGIVYKQTNLREEDQEHYARLVNLFEAISG
jgi:hypothetical protein